MSIVEGSSNAFATIYVEWWQSLLQNSCLLSVDFPQQRGFLTTTDLIELVYMQAVVCEEAVDCWEAVVDGVDKILFILLRLLIVETLLLMLLKLCKIVEKLLLMVLKVVWPCAIALIPSGCCRPRCATSAPPPPIIPRAPLHVCQKRRTVFN